VDWKPTKILTTTKVEDRNGKKERGGRSKVKEKVLGIIMA